MEKKSHQFRGRDHGNSSQIAIRESKKASQSGHWNLSSKELRTMQTPHKQRVKHNPPPTQSHSNLRTLSRKSKPEIFQANQTNNTQLLE